VGPFRRIRDTFLVVLLVAVPFFFLRGSIRHPEEMHVIDRTLMVLSTPVEYVASALARGVSSLIGDYVWLVDVKADNNKLSYANAQLRARVSELVAVEAENKHLRNTLGLRDALRGEAVSAVVVSKNTTNYFRVTRVTLDTASPGVKPNLPVVAVGGVVGTVQRVAGEKIDVQLAVDSGFGVDVQVERTGARGFVRGTGNEGQYAVQVEFVQRDDEVDVGDLLLTSGYGCRFPKGIAVARVTKVVRKEFGIYQRVEAKPTVDFSRLDEVLIVMNDQDNCTPEKPVETAP
jgi:rod shape-determining protein MreC